MKRLITLVILVYSMHCQAQITITSQNVGGQGAVFIMANDENAAGQISLGNPGPNVTWDFSSLDNDVTDTIVFLDPSTIPFWENFPESNIAIKVEDSTYAFARNSNDNLELLGISSRNEIVGLIALPFVPPANMANFPMNYSDTYNQTYSQVVVVPSPQPPADSLKYEIITSEERVVDAWGSLILPWSTFGVLRVDSKTITVTSTYMRLFGNWSLINQETDTSYAYQWWTNHPQAGFILCTVDYDHNTGNIEYVQYLKQFVVYVETADQLAKQHINAYPNPVDGPFFIEINSNLSRYVMVRDINGRLLYSHEVDSPGKIEINLSGCKGVCLWEVRDRTGKLLAGDKIIVN